MSDWFKRISIILLLMVFLIPATGIMIYVHDCTHHHNVSVNLITKEPCCTTESLPDQHDSESCCEVNFLSEADSQAMIDATPCCIDSNLFLKLHNNILVQASAMNDINFVLYFINNTVNSKLQYLTPIVHFAEFDDYSPGNYTFLQLCTLRI